MMKIRHKDKSRVVEFHGQREVEAVDTGGDFYVVAGLVMGDITTDGAYYALPKRLWEPVPEERWVDVTKDVTVQRVGGDCKRSGASEQVAHDIHSIATLHCGGRYRLSKIEVECESEDGPAKRWAFIIEKKET